MTKHEDEWQVIADAVYEELADKLDELAWMDIPFSDDLELAMLELTSRELRLNGVVFETWLESWHRHNAMAQMTTRVSTSGLNICNDEKTVSMTRNLLKKECKKRIRKEELRTSGGGELTNKEQKDLPPLNLRQLVKPVCANDKTIGVFANRIRKNVVEPMAELMVWDAAYEARDVEGRNQPREWCISVGPALSWFQKKVYVPFRGRQLCAFNDKHGKSLG